MRVDVDGPLGAEWMRGRAALVTGGGGRDGGPGTVGWAISRLLARHGAGVAVLDRDPVAAERTGLRSRRAGGRATAVIADVFNDDECARAVAEARDALGGLDTLVNNVAAWSPAELFDAEPAQFDELITREPEDGLADDPPRRRRHDRRWRDRQHHLGGGPARRHDLRARQGRARVDDRRRPRRCSPSAGSASTRSSSGALWTAGVAENLPPEAREPRRRMSALRTEGDCWDAAAAVLFLASDQARWISGQVLTVDGGGPPRAPYPGVNRAPATAGAGS